MGTGGLVGRVIIFLGFFFFCVLLHCVAGYGESLCLQNFLLVGAVLN